MGFPSSNNKKERIDRDSPRHGIDRLRALRKRETDAKARDRLPANGIHVKPKNATQSDQIP